MQAKGLIKFFTIALTVVCIYQLSFSVKGWMVEKQAKKYVENLNIQGENADQVNALKRKAHQKYLDSLANEKVYSLLIKNYSYDQVRDNQLNLGLDLQGGMSVILQVSVEDMIKNMAASNADDPVIKDAIARAKEKEKQGQNDFITLFFQSLYEIEPDIQLSSLFANRTNQGLIEPDFDNASIEQIIHSEANDAIDRTYQILKSRVDQFGVASPYIAKLATSNRIIVELPGVDNPIRARKLLQATAKLEFWETFLVGQVYDDFVAADKSYSTILKLNEDGTSETNPITDIPVENVSISDSNISVSPPDSGISDFSNFNQSDTTNDSTSFSNDANGAATPLLTLLHLNDPNAGIYGPVTGAVEGKDTALVNRILKMPEVAANFREDLKLLWAARPDPNTGFFQIYAIKTNPVDNHAPIEGDVVTDARQSYDQLGRPDILLNMNSEGATEWERLTGANVKGFVAIALDDKVQSSPQVQSKISGGSTEISGNFEVKEAQDLANILKTGKLPAQAKIVQESQVGPTLGAASVRAGIISLVSGMLIVLLFMLFYYSNSGFVANLALVLNIFFIFGILASLGATLTLPGIAGIVLTIGMSVDANVIIFERIREEILRGKGLKLALIDGYKNSYSAIIDANVTTLITAGILFYFGMGPVLGFATVLIIGIFSSVFTAVLVTRLVFSSMIRKDKRVKYGNKITLNTFNNTHFPFLNYRKIAYIASSIIIILGLISFTTKGFDLGVDFKGGRAYEVNFEQSVQIKDVREALTVVFEQSPVVKEVSFSNTLKITTAYLINESSTVTDSIVEHKLYEGLLPYLPEGTTFAHFDQENKLSYDKVEPTIADDIKRTSILATIFALLGIFLYVLLRFRRWQYSIGAIAALAHDVLVVLAVFSIFSGILPFSMEIDEAFIAAILTVIGYSINDTVVVFDRVREYLAEHHKEGSVMNAINLSINSTLSRTLITSLTTLFVLLVLFIFGGDVIRGFTFAILLGVIVGTYSSIFIATPLMADLSKGKLERMGKGNKKK